MLFRSVCRSLHDPNNKLIELLLVAKTAREMGAKQLTLVAPYLCYMRQDMAFHAGEAVSQQIIGQYLGDLFDNLITVDPHLHRINKLDEAIPCQQALSLSATRPLGEFLASHNKQYMLIGPDEESHQWVSAVAAIAGFPYAVANKTRFADKNVKVVLPDIDVQQTNIVLVDDMISTGHTMLEAAQQLFRQGALSVNCLITHALFNQETSKLLKDSGVESIWSTDSVTHPDNVIHLDKLLADSIRNLSL